MLRELLLALSGLLPFFAQHMPVNACTHGKPARVAHRAKPATQNPQRELLTLKPASAPSTLLLLRSFR